MKKSLLFLAFIIAGCQPTTFKFNGCTVTKVSGGVLETCSDGSSQIIHDGSTGPQGNTGATGHDGVNGTNGTNGHNTLISSVAATTTQCPYGGSVLSIGVDLNNNSKLDSSEVTDKVVICNGSNGKDGKDGDDRDDDNKDCDRH